jgi:hypothetical protein
MLRGYGRSREVACSGKGRRFGEMFRCEKTRPPAAFTFSGFVWLQPLAASFESRRCSCPAFVYFVSGLI